MTADQYTELVDFLGRKFERIDVRFDAIENRFDVFENRFHVLENRFGVLEGRLVRVEVGMEAMRHDVQLRAEGLPATNERLDRYHEDHEVRIRVLEDGWLRH